MKILFPVDLAEPEAVTRAVERIAERVEGELYVLHVVTTPAVAPLDPMTGSFAGFASYTQYDPTVLQDIEQAQAHAFHDFLVSHFTRPVHAAMKEGEPARVILDDAEEHDADLIILGKRHHSRLEHLLLGSTVSSVVKRTTRPTLLMPIQKEKK